MLNPFKIFSIILLIAALGLGGFSLYKNRNTAPKKIETDQQQVTPESSNETKPAEPENDSAIFDNETEADNTADSEDRSDNDNAAEDNRFLDILPSDCKNNCKDYKNADDLKYCKQYCGLVSEPESTDSCDKLKDLEKDYCLKNKAIEKRDGNICNKIEDNGIKKSCLNRITEDILDAPIKN